MNDRHFQQEAQKQLGEGRSVLVVAPTGIGKTRAALAPFISGMSNGGLLGSRLLYALPLRALAGGVAEEYINLSDNGHIVVHHGEEPESELFSERALVTTVDQYFTAFAGSPLSWASKAGHAAAGAVLTSYSVFDEVHLLAPRYGLPLLLAILKLRQRWGLPSCVMTATMPNSVVDFLHEKCGLEKVEATDDDVSGRDSWRKVTLKLLGKREEDGPSKESRKIEQVKWGWDEYDVDKLARLVKEKWESWDNIDLDVSRKIIVFVNTVDRAIQVYERLQGYLGTERVLLAHSRFTKEDRQKVEQELQKFGRNSDFEGVLVTTQVAEAGLNISAPLMITELCPIDSLIQRIGRCQRFKPEGDKGNQEMQGLVLVVKPQQVEEKQKWHIPYMDEINVREKRGNKVTNARLSLAEVSRNILEERFANGGLLDWKTEKAIVDDTLSDAYSAFLNGLDILEYEDIKDKPLGKAYQRLKKLAPVEEGTPLEEADNEGE